MVILCVDDKNKEQQILLHGWFTHFVCTNLISAQEGIVALEERPVSRQSPKVCPRNSANACRVEHRSFTTSRGEMAAAPFLHSSLHQAMRFLKRRSTSDLPSCRPDVRSAVPASLSDRSFPLTLACPRQWTQRSLYSQRLHGCVPVGAVHWRLHLLQEVHWICENDCMCNLCVKLAG